MKLQHQLLAIAVLLTMSVNGMAGISAEEKREHLRLLQTEALSRARLTPLDHAYLDTLMALEGQNTCSEFFGGRAAQPVLEELVINLRATRINDTAVGIRMFGPFAVFVNSEKNFFYRLFANVDLNTTGPFLQIKGLRC